MDVEQKRVMDREAAEKRLQQREQQEDEMFADSLAEEWEMLIQEAATKAATVEIDVNSALEAGTSFITARTVCFCSFIIFGTQHSHTLTDTKNNVTGHMLSDWTWM